MAKVTVRQTGSPIRRTKDQRATLVGLEAFVLSLAAVNPDAALASLENLNRLRRATEAQVKGEKTDLGQMRRERRTPAWIRTSKQARFRKSR